MSQTPVIYVIDDDPAICDALQDWGEAFGLCIRAFSDAQTFLDQPPPQRPCCVLVDLNMPNVNGLALLHEMEARGLDLPVIGITADRDSSLGQKASRILNQRLLEKPFDPQTLFRAIQEALDETGDPQPSA